ncbi:hypothetical protein DL770_010111 [Monosporascus sp. CRB-9-2]|nr:hypothetical protein DL770_010111 [Monosporascus sp. CRB-9-2]
MLRVAATPWLPTAALGVTTAFPIISTSKSDISWKPVSPKVYSVDTTPLRRDTVSQPWERDIGHRTIRPGGDQPGRQSRYVTQEFGFSGIKNVDDAPGEGVAREISKAKRFGMIEVKFFRYIESGGAGIAPQASREQSPEFVSKPFKGSPSLYHKYADRFLRVQFTEEKWLRPKLFGNPNKTSISVANFPVTTRAASVAAPPIISPSASRCQLEACISQGVLSEHNMTGEFVRRVAQPTATPTTPVANGQLSYHTSTAATAAPPITNPPIAASPSAAEIRKTLLAKLRSPNLRLVPKHWEKLSADQKRAIRVVRVFAAEKKKDKNEEEKKKDDAERRESLKSRITTKPQA